MPSMSSLGHVLAAMRRATGRVLLTFIVTLLVVGGGTEAGHAIFTTNHSNGIFTHIIAAIVGVGWALALSLFVIVGEIVRFAIAGVRDTVQGVEREVKDAGGLAGQVVQSVERRGDKK